MRWFIVLFLCLLFLLAVPANAVDYDPSIEPLLIDTTIDFHPYDRRWGSVDDFSFGVYNGSSTVAKTLWIGTLPLVTDPQDFNNTLSFNVTLDLLSYDGEGPLRATVLLNTSLEEKAEQGVGRGLEYLAEISSASLQVNQSFEGNSKLLHPEAPISLENGTIINRFSYYSLLNVATDDVFFHTLQLMLTSSGNWTHTARVRVKVETSHDPSFYRLMLDRHRSANLGHMTTTSGTISPTGTEDVSFKWWFSLYALPVVFLRKRKPVR